MEMELTKPDKLNKDEMERLDSLLGAARAFNYLAFILSGVSFAISSLDNPADFRLPLGEIAIPQLQATVAIYLVVIVLSMGCFCLWSMAQPWIKCDPRRPPFPWIILGTEGAGGGRAILILFPALLCAISTSLSLKNNSLSGFGLALISIFPIMLPSVAGRYWRLISTRSDHRGGLATLSIWVLYWYRIVRNSVLTAFLLISVFLIVPNWKDQALLVGSWLFRLAIVLVFIRLFGTFPFVYRRIDRLGKRYGFPVESKHYT